MTAFLSWFRLYSSNLEGPFHEHRCALKTQVLADGRRGWAMEEEGQEGMAKHATRSHDRLQMQARLRFWRDCLPCLIGLLGTPWNKTAFATA